MQEQNLDHNIGKYHKQQHVHELILGKRDTILYQAWKLAFVIRLTFHRTLLGTIFLAGMTFLPLILKGIRFSFLFVNAFHNLCFFSLFLLRKRAICLWKLQLPFICLWKLQLPFICLWKLQLPFICLWKLQLPFTHIKKKFLQPGLRTSKLLLLFSFLKNKNNIIHQDMFFLLGNTWL